MNYIQLQLFLLLFSFCIAAKLLPVSTQKLQIPFTPIDPKTETQAFPNLPLSNFPKMKIVHFPKIKSLNGLFFFMEWIPRNSKKFPTSG